MKLGNGILIYILVVVCSALVLSGCKKKAEEILVSVEEVPAVVAPTCSLSGHTWVMCDPYNGTSGRYTMTITGTQMDETVEFFPNNDTCSGAPDSNYTYSFSGTLTVGNLGESTYMQDATDIQLVSAGNNLGCGVNQPVYTWALIAEDCQSFYNPNIGSSCNPNNLSGFTPSTNPFVRQ